MRLTFSGGVHPREAKDATKALPIEAFEAPQVLVVPLLQHIGAPARAAVKAGDKVAKGETIGEPGGFISAAVHAPVSGTVSAVEPRLGPGGRKIMAVVIENDGEDRWADGTNVKRDTSSLDADTIRNIASDAGLVGMGGAAFPTHVKLSPPDNKPIELLLVNGAECEPFLTADHRLMLEEPERIAFGAQLAARAVSAARIIFALEDNKPDAAETLEKAASKIPSATVVTLPTRYPQGAEKQLIEAVTGRQVPSGGLPMDVGVLVQNVGTCAALQDACAFNVPLIERITTVTGPSAGRPANLRVRIGTLYEALFERVGFAGAPRRIVMGGPMMGMAQGSVEVPVTKGTSGIVLLDSVPGDVWRACIRCGKCVRACPVSIVPSQISVFLERGYVDEANEIDMLDCIECGCCTYVCPARRPIVNWIKAGKAELAERRAREREGAK